MGWTNGGATYGYTVTLNLQSIVDAIAKNMLGEVVECDVNDDCLEVDFSHHAYFNEWNCPQTLESPAEHEIEFRCEVAEDIDPKNAIYKALQSIKLDDIDARIYMDDEEFWDFDGQEED